MIFHPAKFKGIVIVEPKIHRDDRGLFLESFKEELFKKAGVPTTYLQDNFSQSRRGVIRGMHYQLPPFEQGKLVRCVKGALQDVVIDIRRDSPTFGEYESFELTDQNFLSLYVPPGFAHGIQALKDDTVIFYKCTNVYSKEHERGLHALDPKLSIPWSISNPEFSPKDLELPKLSELSETEKKNSLF